MAYPIVNTIFRKTDADLSAAEAHGMATGMLCVNERTMAEHWLAELLLNSDNPIADADQQILIRLFNETRRLLASDEFEFDLFLPDDNVPLSQQVLALKNWCQGFLLGIGSVHQAAGVSSGAREILRDISEFTKLDVDAEGEEDERALAEIIEYLRSAVLLLRDELSSQSKEEVPGEGFETNRI